MSAFMVNKSHVDALVSVALHGPSDRGPKYPGDGWRFHSYYAAPLDGCTLDEMQALRRDVRWETADEIGRALWVENLRSIMYRYPDTIDSGEYPGPVGLSEAEILNYVYMSQQRTPTTVEALKLLDCLEYQSCEHPEWNVSESKHFCEALRAYLIGSLPGYDEAPWEWEVAVTA